MGKEQKATDAWKGFLRGLAAAFGIYLLGMVALAALMVNGTVPEKGTFGFVLVWCLVSVFCGGCLTIQRVPWGKLPAAVLFAALFAGIVMIVGTACWQETCWSGKSSGLFGSMVGGGVLAAMLGNRKQRHRKTKGHREISQKLKKGKKIK